MNISVLGCGWLGWPLGKRLVRENHYVKGSTTSQNKMQKLKEEGITPYLLKVYPEGIRGDLTAFLSEAQVLIINLPPNLRKNPEADFIGKTERLVNYIEKSPVEKLIFISSTSVYQDKEDFPDYTEEDEANGTSETAKQLIAAENILFESKHYETSILRFGGLTGPGRHPVNHLAGKSGIKNPKAPINLIHREDCIEIIHQIIEKEAWGEIFNAVYPKHPPKEDYYSNLAREKNLALPEFEKNGLSKGKKISCEKLEKNWGYSFKNEI